MFDTCLHSGLSPLILPKHPHPCLQSLSPTTLRLGTASGGPHFTQQKILSKVVQLSGPTMVKQVRHIQLTKNFYALTKHLSYLALISD